jgi:hypothetical protein
MKWLEARHGAREAAQRRRVRRRVLPAADGIARSQRQVRPRGARGRRSALELRDHEAVVRSGISCRDRPHRDEPPVLVALEVARGSGLELVVEARAPPRRW